MKDDNSISLGETEGYEVLVKRAGKRVHKGL